MYIKMGVQAMTLIFVILLTLIIMVFGQGSCSYSEHSVISLFGQQDIDSIKILQNLDHGLNQTTLLYDFSIQEIVDDKVIASLKSSFEAFAKLQCDRHNRYRGQLLLGLRHELHNISKVVQALRPGLSACRSVLYGVYFLWTDLKQKDPAQSLYNVDWFSDFMDMKRELNMARLGVSWDLFVLSEIDIWGLNQLMRVADFVVATVQLRDVFTYGQVSHELNTKIRVLKERIAAVNSSTEMMVDVNLHKTSIEGPFLKRRERVSDKQKQTEVVLADYKDTILTHVRKWGEEHQVKVMSSKIDLKWMLNQLQGCSQKISGKRHPKLFGVVMNSLHLQGRGEVTDFGKIEEDMRQQIGPMLRTVRKEFSKIFVSLETLGFRDRDRNQTELLFQIFVRHVQNLNSKASNGTQRLTLFLGLNPREFSPFAETFEMSHIANFVAMIQAETKNVSTVAGIYLTWPVPQPRGLSLKFVKSNFQPYRTTAVERLAEVRETVNSAGLKFGVQYFDDAKGIGKMSLHASANHEHYKVLIEASDFVIWKFDFWTALMTKDNVDLLTMLNRILQSRHDFNLEYPGVQVIMEGDWASRGIQGRAASCSGFQDFWSGISEWSELTKFPIISSQAFDNFSSSGYSQKESRWYSRHAGWWKVLNYEGNNTEAIFFSKNEDACVPEFEEPKSRIKLNKQLVGVTFQLEHTDLNMEASVLRLMLEIILLKFDRIEVDLSQSLRNCIECRKNWKAPFGEVGSSRNYTLPLYYAIHPLTDSELVNSVIPESAKGIHLILDSDPLNNTNKNLLKYESSLKALKQSTHFWKNSPSIGISLDNCVDQGSNDDLVTLLKSGVNYVICQVKLKTLFKINLFRSPKALRTDLEILLDNLLLFRTKIQQTSTNTELEVMLQVACPSTVQGSPNTGNFLVFWKFLNDWATIHMFPCFVYQAFEGISADKHDDASGWWRIQNFANLKNLSSYAEKESEYLHLEDPISHLDKIVVTTAGNSVVEVNSNLLWLGLLGLVLLALVGVIIFIAFRYRQVLTQQELDNFRLGTSGDKELKVILGEHAPDDIGYDEETFEVPKKDILFTYTAESRVGVGHFGEVYKGKIATHPDPVAVKTPKEDVDVPVREVVISLLYEIKAMIYIGDHPNVLRFLGAYTAEIKHGIILIMTEFCKNGDLLSYLQKRREQPVALGGLSHRMIQFCQEIASGMSYIAGKMIIHRDLAARNILLDGDLRCKISDFGLSRSVNKEKEYVRKSNSPLAWRWMALEALKFSQFSLKSDVWSFGVTCWEIFSLGDQPFPDLHYGSEFLAEMDAGLRLPRPENCSERIFERIASCWDAESEARPDFQELYEFFRKVRANDDYTCLMEVSKA